MRKMRKLTAMLLAGIMSLSVLAGCGGKDAGSPDASASSTGTDTGTENGLTYNGQDVSEPVELVMYYIGDKTEDEDLILTEINKILKEKINATLVLKNMSLSDYSTKYALTIAGGENFDLIYTSTWAYYQSEANKGAFAEVTEPVLNDYMPLHKENQADASWGQAKIGGKVYFVPCNMANVSANAILIRGDLREKYGTIDFQDFMEFVDHVCEQYPAIDPARIGVTGGSYGGWMTNWIIGHTDRFAAAVSQRSFSNWLSDFGCSEIGFSFDVNENGGKTPWTAPKELWERSPVAYADRVKTPTMFIHSLKDYNCPLSEGMQMFAAIKYHGVPSKAVLFEGENHELSRSGKPLHRMRRLQEMNGWFDLYLKGEKSEC